jgi:hypothetical protein
LAPIHQDGRYALIDDNGNTVLGIRPPNGVSFGYNGHAYLGGYNGLIGLEGGLPLATPDLTFGQGFAPNTNLLAMSVSDFTAANGEYALTTTRSQEPTNSPTLLLSANALRVMTGVQPATRTEAMRIDPSGNVGIGTATPTANLDVQGANAVLRVSGTNPGITTLSLSQQGSGEWRITNNGDFNIFNNGTQILDMNAAVLNWFGQYLNLGKPQGTTPVQITSYTYNGGVAGDALTFGTYNQNGATQPVRIGITGGTDVATVYFANSNVGIGTTTPDQLLSVNGDASKTGSSTWATFSDERLKNIKGGFVAGIDELMQISPIRYRYKRDNPIGIRDQKDHVGVSAQQIERVLPEAVSKNAKGYRLVDTDPIIWTMLNAIKQQEARARAQQSRIDSLEAQLRALTRNSH